METHYGNLRKNYPMKFNAIKKNRDEIIQRARERGFIYTADFIRYVTLKDVEEGKKEKKMVITHGK